MDRKALLAMLPLVLAAGPAWPIDFTLAWTEASGPVAFYDVLVQRNGGGYTIEQSVDAATPQAVVTCQPGESFTVRVGGRAADDRVGPLSVASDPIHCLPKDVEPMTAPGSPTIVQIAP